MDVESLVDLAKKQIQELVIMGTFQPGQQLKEDELCNRFHISRPPIREAFKVLEAEGLVTRKPRRGVFVVELTPKDVWEIYTLKAAIYQVAAYLAMKVMTDKDLEALEATVDQMAVCVATDPVDLRQYQFHHRAFHEIVLALAGNDRMTQVENNLRFQISRISYNSLKKSAHLHSSLEYHRQIVEAMKKGDRALACRLMKEHVLEALDLALALLSADSKQPPISEDINRFRSHNDIPEIKL